MQFRWCAAIALWTILSGPIMNGQGPSRISSREARQHTTVQRRPTNRDTSPPIRVILTSRSQEQQ